jgi:uncharacterized protein (TIGR03435 family)
VTSGAFLFLSSAIGNHLWQTTIFAGGIWIVALILRNSPARTRYLLWMTASAKFLVPFSLLIGLGSYMPKSQEMTSPGTYAVINLMGEPFSEVSTATTSVVHVPTLGERLASDLPIVLGMIWIFGVVAVLLIWCIRWHRIAAIKFKSRPASVGRMIDLLRRAEQATGQMVPMRMRLSSDRLEPGVFGILRPVLLWPEGLSARLDDEHIEAILTHELIHVQRRDNLTAALHMLVEAVFWFHPLVWAVERRLVEERERACDEAVIRLGRAPEAYAESLLKACRYCVESPLRCMSGLTGIALNKRILSIMTTNMVDKVGLGARFLLLTIGIVAIAMPLVLGEVRTMQESGSTIEKDMAPAAKPLPSAMRRGLGDNIVAQAAQESGSRPVVAQAPTTSGAQATLAGPIQASADRLIGTWQGTLQQGKKLRTVIRIVKGDDGEFKSVFYSIDESGNEVPATKTTFAGNTVKISILMNGGTYDGNLSPDGSSIVGMWSSPGQTPVPLNLARATPGTEWIIPAATPMVPPMDRNADPAFEVATIKPSKSDHIKRFLLSPRHFKGDNVTLDDLIVFSYGLHPKQLEAAPGWAASDKYDIEAEPDGEGRPSYDQWKIMVRKLLAERWKLRFHQEKKELSVYVLSVTPKGSKLTKSQGTPTGLPGLSYRGRVGGDIAAVNASTGDFINWMTRNVGLDRPIIDQTGLKGRYDFTLDWTPDDSQFGGAASTLDPTADEGSRAPSLYVALQEQLGLKLIAGKALADVLLIDHVENPSEN